MSHSDIPPPAALPSDGMSKDRSIPRARVWILALAAGLIAGFVSWVVGERIHGRYGPQTIVSTSGSATMLPSPAETQSRANALKAAETLDATLVFGSLGAVLGLALGLAGGLSRRASRAGTWAAAIGGSILAATVGLAMIRIMLPIYVRQTARSS